MNYLWYHVEFYIFKKREERNCAVFVIYLTLKLSDILKLQNVYTFLDFLELQYSIFKRVHNSQISYQEPFFLSILPLKLTQDPRPILI